MLDNESKADLSNLTNRAEQIIHILRKATKDMTEPMSDVISREYNKDPYLILISCLLSLRAKDSITLPISRKLFQVVRTPQEMLSLPLDKLENIIRSIGFYRQKAKTLHSVSKELIDRFNGNVPNTEEKLLTIKGIGRKTANLVLGQAFDIPAICVDIHVHRISNRLGLVKTKTPAETEQELKKLLPKKYWVEWNKLLVIWGQNICVPISPFCSKCAIYDLCDRVGVKKYR